MQMTKWQQRYMILFENHVNVKNGEIFDHYFKKDIEHIRSLLDKDGRGLDYLHISPIHSRAIARLSLRYRFPTNMLSFLSKYIATGEIDPSLITSHIKIVDGRNKTLTQDTKASHGLWLQYQDDAKRSHRNSHDLELKIVIDDEVSREQLRDYITDHWDVIEAGIKAKPSLHERAIIRPHLNAKRDYRVLALLESGLTHDEVALQIQKEYPGYSPTYMAIQKIKAKIKALHEIDL